MTLVPVLPETAPFTPAQRAWLNGFLAGLYSRGNVTGSDSPAPASKTLKPLSILFASQTGTAERLAKKASKLAGKRGFAPTLVEASQSSLEKLAAEGSLLLISSTYGDGEAPDSAKALLKALASSSGKPLEKLRFSVCALGDSNYAKFCQAGKDFDQALGKLGGVRILERTDCDLGQEDLYTAWLDKALNLLGEAASPEGAGTVQPAAAGEDEEEDAHKPVEAKLVSVTRLNGEGSAKEVNHVCIQLAGTGLAYQAGDALSVRPANAPALVAEMLGLLASDGEEEVAVGKARLSLRRALETALDLGKPSPALLKLLELPSEPAPHHVIDALLASPKRPPTAALLTALKPLQPRLYSISSSPTAHAGEVHLTVGAVRYEHSGRARQGVCSTFLAERALEIGKVEISVHTNNGFRLPANPETPVIMVGPGTGIAPFRAFLHERIASGAKGANWLFFGDQRAATDFLYREELEGLEKQGLLRLSLAWSRDQTAKVYVQNRMQEAAAELWDWLQRGAHLYVCGDASRMAKDVDAALHRVIETAGGKTAEEAVLYVEELKGSRRYQRDVY
jgi:sulfite reductase (NADPH) flavoprotein alpha-component